MSATTIDELQVLISANATAFQREMKNIRAELGQIGRSAKESTGSVTGGFIKAQLALGGLKTAFGAIGSAARQSVKDFGSLEQNLGGAEAVFGQFSDAVKQAAKDSAKTMGTSMSQYLGSANKMGSLFQGAGYDAQKSMIMTTKAMQRAADVASVMGISQEAALESVAGMAKGNFTMMDNLGVAMNDTALAAYMLERGIAGNVNQMTIGEKVGIAYQMFMDRTSKYAGNFARESMTLEGSLAIMRAELSNVSATLGMAFAPMVSSAASFVSNVLAPAISAVIPYIVALGNIINQVAASVFSFIGGIFGASKGISGVGSSSKSASNAMKNLGTSAGGAGGGMGGAAKGAKALKKELAQLAKFDEMNVLKSPEDPSGGSGGSGGAGGGAPTLEMPEMNFGKFNSGFDEISAKAKKIADEIKKFFDGMFDFNPMKKSLKIFTEGARKAIEGIAMIGEKFISKFIIPVSKFQIEKTIPMVLTAIGEALKSINFEVIAESAGNLFAEIGSLVNVLSLSFAGLIEIIAPFAAWVANFIVPPTFEILATVIKIVRTAIEGVGYAISGLWKMIEPAFKALGEALKPVLDWLGKTLKSIRENETFMNILKDAFTAVTIVILGPLVAALGAIVVAITAVIEIVKLVVRFFVDGWNSVVRLWNMAGSFFSNVSNNIRSAFNGIGVWFSNVFNGARDLVFNAFSGVGRWFGDRWNDIWNAFSNVWGVFSNIGRNIVDGLKSGLGSIGRVARDMANSFVQGFKNFLGIHSPSRVFRDLGGFVGEGFSLGIENEQKSVMNALNGLTSDFEIPTFSIRTDFSVAKPSELTNIDNLSSKLRQEFEVSHGLGGLGEKLDRLNEKPQRIVVKIGEEKLVDRLIDGINKKSFLRNESLIDI